MGAGGHTAVVSLPSYSVIKQPSKATEPRRRRRTTPTKFSAAAAAAASFTRLLSASDSRDGCNAIFTT